MSSDRPTVVLIPGAWHGVKYFDEYRHGLESHGFPCLTVPLPSAGAKSPFPTIWEDVAHIRLALLPLLDEDKEVILVMHCYGGLPGSEAVTGLSKPERMGRGMPGGVVTLLYIAAFLLPWGESIESFEHLFTPPTPAWVRFNAQGRAYITNGRAAFYHDLEEEKAVKWASRLETFSIGCFRSPAESDPYRLIDTVYVVCKQDRAILPNRQWEMVRHARLEKWVSLDTGHNPILGAPSLLAEITKAAAGEEVILTEGSLIATSDVGKGFEKLRIAN